MRSFCEALRCVKIVNKIQPLDSIISYFKSDILNYQSSKMEEEEEGKEGDGVGRRGRLKEGRARRMRI
jgi:hypothetical protein